jgi:uncharacterized Zn finger protein
MENLFALAREMAQPRVWSAGVELARNAEFVRHTDDSAAEQVVRIIQGSKDRIVTVTLAADTEVWQCDCGSDDDPCRHIVASILAFKQNKVGETGSRQRGQQVGVPRHSFTRQGAVLVFARSLVFGEEDVAVLGTLVGAIEEQRKKGRSVAVTDDELKIDYVLPSARSGALDPKTMRHLLPALSRVREVQLDGKSVRIDSEPLVVHCEVVD